MRKSPIDFIFYKMSKRKFRTERVKVHYAENGWTAKNFACAKYATELQNVKLSFPSSNQFDNFPAFCINISEQIYIYR